MSAAASSRRGCKSCATLGARPPCPPPCPQPAFVRSIKSVLLDSSAEYLISTFFFPPFVVVASPGLGSTSAELSLSLESLLSNLPFSTLHHVHLCRFLHIFSLRPHPSRLQQQQQQWHATPLPFSPRLRRRRQLEARVHLANHRVLRSPHRSSCITQTHSRSAIRPSIILGAEERSSSGPSSGTSPLSSQFDGHDQGRRGALSA